MSKLAYMLIAEGEPRKEVLSPPEPRIKYIEKRPAQLLQATEQWLVDGYWPRMITSFWLVSNHILSKALGLGHAPDIKGLLAKQVVH